MHARFHPLAVLFACFFAAAAQAAMMRASFAVALAFVSAFAETASAAVLLQKTVDGTPSNGFIVATNSLPGVRFTIPATTAYQLTSFDAYLGTTGGTRTYTLKLYSVQGSTFTELQDIGPSVDLGIGFVTRTFTPASPISLAAGKEYAVLCLGTNAYPDSSQLWVLSATSTAPSGVLTYVAHGALFNGGWVINTGTTPPVFTLNGDALASTTVTGITRLGTSPTNAASVQWQVVFAAPVTGLTAANFALATTGSSSGAAVTSVSGSGTTYTVTASTGTTAGTIGLNFANTTGLAPAASNAVFTGQTYSVDTVRPTVTINQAAGQADPTTASPINFSVVFSEPVTGFAGTDVSFAGSTAAGTLAAAVNSISATQYTVSVTGMTGGGTVVASIPAGAAQDAVGNTSAASTSTDNAVTYLVTTTTALAATPNPAVYGQAVTLTATVSPSTATGTVTFREGATTLACTEGVQPRPVTSGGATCTVAGGFGVGAHSLTAAYGGSATTTASQGTTNLTVNKANTITTITADTPDPSLIGQAVTVNYSVVAAAPGAGTPAGNVTVSDGVDNCTGTVAAGTCTINLTTVGSRTLTATYAGDANFNGGASAGAAHTVSPTADLSVTVDDGVASVAQGDTTTYTVVVRNAGPSDVVGATVSDPLPTGVGAFAWTCIASAGSTCPASGSGPINATVDLLAGGTATFTVTATVEPGATGTITNTATVAPPAGTVDPTAANDSASDTDAVAAAADIRVAKAVDNPTPNAGDTIIYTVTATNDGPSDATGVQVTDALPTGLTLLGSTPSQGTYDPASGLWDVGALAANASATLTLETRVEQEGALTNVATRTAGDQIDLNASNNAGGVTLTGAPSADIQVQKRVDNALPNVGDTVAFTVTVTNAGPSDATGVRIADLLPTGLALVGTPAPSVGIYDPATGLWDLGALAANASATLALDARVEQAGAITNTAAKTAQGENDPVAANDQSGVTVSGQQADVQLVKTVDNSAPLVGQNVVFTVTATNNGPSDATGVVVADALPAGLSFVSATPSQGAYDPANGTWTVGALAATGPGATATLALAARVDRDGSLVNTATKTAQDQPDPNAANDRASAAIGGLPVADLGITKTDNATSAVAGQQITYTIVATNAGPSAATGATVTDALPAVLTDASWSCVASAGSGCPAAGVGDLAATVDLAVGGTATFTLSATVSPAASGALANTATVIPPAGATDPDPADDSATDTDAIVARPGLSITKSDGLATATAGQALTYTIVAANAGPSAAPGATVTDALPAALSDASWTCAGAGGATCAAAGASSIADTVDLPVGGSVTYTLQATIARSFVGTLANTASVTPVGGAPIAATDQTSVTAAPPPAVIDFSGPTATGTGDATASLSGLPAGCGFTLAEFIPVEGHPHSPPAGSAPGGVAFPQGLFNFKIGGTCGDGFTATVVVTYPQPLPAGTQYYKYGPTPAHPAPSWYALPATVTGNSVSFTLTDGALGDDDLAANGSLVDQGGPGVAAAPPPADIPTWSEWTALLAALGLLLVAGAQHRRRSRC